jgi:predicted nucleotidyltransferase
MSCARRTSPELDYNIIDPAFADRPAETPGERPALQSVTVSEMATPKGQTLDQAVLDEIVQRIVAVAQPEKIILFGSAVRGEMGRHSDVDLLVVKDGADRRRTAARIYRRLHGVGAAVDVIVVTLDDVERYRDSHALIIKPALHEGRVVYDAA